jgi:hypothetical protein
MQAAYRIINIMKKSIGINKDNINIFLKKNLSNIVIAASICLLLFFFAYTFLRKGTYITAVIKIGSDSINFASWRREESTPKWFSSQFRPGMKELDGIGRTNAEVLSVRSYDSSPNNQNVYLTVKLRATYARGSNQYTYKGKPILVGSVIKTFLGNILAEGMVTHIEGDTQDNGKKHKIILKTKVLYLNQVFPETTGVLPHIADSINVNQEIKDTQGNLAITVKEKIVTDAKKLVTTSGGQIIVTTNPLLKDLSLTLEVYAEKIQNKYFVFDDIPILIDQFIPLHTDTVSLYPTITEIVSID